LPIEVRLVAEVNAGSAELAEISTRAASRLAGTYAGRVLKGAIIVSSFCHLRSLLPEQHARLAGAGIVMRLLTAA
jgi:hypothetical protein